jgi:hypothetical protein
MRARRRVERHREDEEWTRVPTYLLPPEVSVVVFDPALQRAKDIRREG